MIHPLINNASELTMTELEGKVAELTKKYFMTTNTDLQSQISAAIAVFSEALSTKRQAEWDKLQAKSDKHLDKLINIS